MYDYSSGWESPDFSVNLSQQVTAFLTPSATPVIYLFRYVFQKSFGSFIMSLITRDNRITVKQCAYIPAIGDLPSIKRAPPSVSNASSRSGSRGIGAGVKLMEGCMVTKTIKYTHQLAYFVSAVRSGGPTPVVSRNSSGQLIRIC